VPVTFRYLVVISRVRLMRLINRSNFVIRVSTKHTKKTEKIANGSSEPSKRLFSHLCLYNYVRMYPKSKQPLPPYKHLKQGETLPLNYFFYKFLFEQNILLRNSNNSIIVLFSCFFLVRKTYAIPPFNNQSEIYYWVN